VIDVLQLLSASDLSALGLALRSGRLSPPVTELSVQRHCGVALASALASSINLLISDGMQPRHIATMLDAMIQTRKNHHADSELVELVWSGPEARGITNRDTGVVVRELFGSALTEIIIAGFAVYQGHSLFLRLTERMTEVPKLKVKLYLEVRRPHGDTSSASELLWKFKNNFQTHQWPGEKLPELYYDPRSLDDNQEKRSSLHAKCIIVDRRMTLVTSANFTEAAQLRNIEAGSLIRSESFSTELARHFELLTDEKLLVPFN
jgi:phosphatidylserine/phosphatidylglycerophosphate/cardiolipin synthase-like enzyme